MPIEDPDASLESLLRRPPLRQPGDQLDSRVFETFDQFRPQFSRYDSGHSTRRFRLYPMAIAAGVLLVLGIGFRLSLLPRFQPHPINTVAATAPVPDTFPGPIQLVRETSTVYDDGVVANTDDGAYQQLRRRNVREIWVLDPATHAQLQVTIPTEQILIQKVDAY